MATVVGEGTLTADGTEQEVVSSALQATFQFLVRLNAMQSGDAVTVSLWTKLGGAGTLRKIYEASFTNAQAAPNLVQIGPPVPSGWEFEARIEQTAGSLRDFEWRLDSIGSVEVASSGLNIIGNTTETTLFTTAINGTYVFAADLVNMAGSDTLTLRAKTATISGGGVETLYSYAPTAGPQADPNRLMFSIPVSAPYGFSATLQQGHSNSRSYSWVAYRVGE